MAAVKSYRQIWSALSVETRVAAASAMLAHPDEKSSRAKALSAIAAKRKIRLKTVLQLAPAKQAAYLAGIAIDESLASAMVRCYLLRDHRPMLKTFLDALGIPNVNGESEEMPTRPPDPDRLERAVASVAKFPRDAVELYFDALAALDRPVWGGLRDFAFEPTGLTPSLVTPEKAIPQQETARRPASRRHAPDDRDLSALDEMAEAAILGWASGTEGALETAKILAALEELLRLNAARPRSYFHKGLLDASQERSRDSHFDGRDEEHRLWYLCGAVAAHTRAGRHERIAELYENEKMDAFGSQLVPRSLRVVEPIFEALCGTNRAGVAARFLSPKMLAYAGMFETTLNWGTRLLHHGNHLEAEMLFNVIERSLPHFATGEIAAEKLQVLERRRAHCFRLKRDFQRSEAILAKLVVQPELKNLSPVLTDLAMVRAHFRGLFDVIIPADTGRVTEFCRAMHRIEHALSAALQAPGEKSHAQYCLGVLALADTAAGPKQSLRAAELLESSIVYILSRGTTYETGGLPQRARFYLALALAETLDETRTKYALELFVESLRMGFAPPAHLLRRFIDALSIADSESAREAAEAALAELRQHNATMESILTAEIARRSMPVWDALHCWTTERRSPRRRFEDEEVLLREALFAQQMERAETALDALESLAVAGTYRERFIKLVSSPEAYEAIWSQSEANWASVHVLELCGRYEEAAAVLRKEFHQRIWSGEYGARAEGDDIIARIESYGLGGAAFADLKSTLASVEATAAPPAAVPNRGTTPVCITVVGGDETHARCDDAIRARVQATMKNVTLNFRHTSWSSNWGEQFQSMKPLLQQSDVVVVMRLIRTNLGRTLRKHCPNWIGCSGRSPASIQRAIETAVQFARRRKKNDIEQ